MSNVLVTGGAGFIGSTIVDQLVEKGYNVSIVDDLSTGYEKNLNPKARFHKQSICDSGLKKVFAKEKPEKVIHEAAQINVRKSIYDPAYDANINILGSINLLECCRENKVEKVLYASSGGAIYGEPTYLPADEKHPVRPLCPYGASKYSVENYLGIYQKNYALDYVALRYANVYGPRQDPLGEAGVVAIFTNKLLSDQDPLIFGDGKQTRDFVYVEDVARANVLALEKRTLSTEYNIGTGEETSVNQIYEKLKELIATTAKASHAEEVPGEVRHIYLDTSKAKKELGWTPATCLDEGMRKTVEWTREQL